MKATEATAAAAAAAALASEKGAEELAQAGEARGERVRELRDALAAALEAKAAAEERLAGDVGRLEQEVYQLVALSSSSSSQHHHQPTRFLRPRNRWNLQRRRNKRATRTLISLSRGG